MSSVIVDNCLLSLPLSLSFSPSVSWPVVPGSVWILRSPFDPLATQSLTWQRANSISSEFCLPIYMETVSLQSRPDPSRLRSSKVVAMSRTCAHWLLGFDWKSCSQVCRLLPVRWLLRGKRTRPSSSSGHLQRNPTIWLVTTSTSVWRVPRTGCQPITSLTRTPSVFELHNSWLENCICVLNLPFFFDHLTMCLQVCG